MIHTNFDELRGLSTQEILRQAVFTVKRESFLLYHKKRDYFYSTQLNVRRIKRNEVVIVPDLSGLQPEGIDREIAKELCCMYMNHRFDLLGSGWVRCGFFSNAPGVEGYRYEGLEFDEKDSWLHHIVDEKDYANSKEIYNLVSKEYIPIDWQKDYKTGFRWSAKEWYRPIKIAEEPGADIKVPWELSRMQHLPRLALFYKMFPEEAERIKQEFMDECLDFIAQNPVRKGVNWMCTMDVAIRTANIVLAYWLFVSFEACFPKCFQEIIWSTINIHCKHIRNNLEWSIRLRSNHYFANICGLLFGAAFVGNRRWIRYAREQYKVELLEQFYPEGSNFEGSIGYHRLSGEMAIYTGALIECLSKERVCNSLDEKEKERLLKIGKFAEDTMTPDGSFVQIGDNDSGRFFNLTPLGEVMSCDKAIEKYCSLRDYQPEEERERYFDEHINSPIQLVAACNALKGMDERSYNCSVEQTIIKCMINYQCFEEREGLYSVNDNKSTKINKLPYELTWQIDADNNISLIKDLIVREYPEFGIYIFKSPMLYLCFNITDNGQRGNAGHAHNDKLSFELWINNKPIYQDAGTYLYTAIMEERDRFRSVRAHNTLQSNIEQNEYRGTFSMSNDTCTRVISTSNDAIEAEVVFKNVIQRRKIQIYATKILITDSSNQSFTINRDDMLLTNGYGKLLRKKEK